jgi:NADH-quinone oxidoreductase subunit G
VLEFILVNHPVDCPICDQAGECKLQDYYMDYDAQGSRQRTVKVSKVKVYPLGPEVVYDGERCILCTRCVRFCDEITGTSELTTIDRGDRTTIQTFPGHELANAYSMCVVDLCPVGALTSRNFRFKCRVWLLTSTDSVCAGCARACSIHLEHFRGEVQRYRPRYHPEVNEYWMCDAGRYTHQELHRDRLKQPQINGAPYTWAQITGKLAEILRARLDEHGPSAFGVVLSPQASCEDLMVARRFAQETLGVTRFYVGGKPDGDHDDFLIHADKNPNRNGLLLTFPKDARPKPFSALLDDLASGALQVLWVMGAEVPVEGEALQRFLQMAQRLDQVILQAPRGGALAEIAHVNLPTCTHAEKDGTFINADGVVQPFLKAFEPKVEALPDWQVFLHLARKLGKPLGYLLFQDLQRETLEAVQRHAAT